MIYNERNLREAQALDIAQKMLVAARTAPKGKGIDVLECAVVNGDEKEALAVAMETIGKERGHAFFLRDAGCVRTCQCVVLVGTRPKDSIFELRLLRVPRPAARSPPKHLARSMWSMWASRSALPSRVRKPTGSIRASCSPLALPLNTLAYLVKVFSQVLAIPVSISSKSPFFDRG